jgi:predicted nucleotidyltransferase
MASPVSTTTERAEQGLAVLIAAAREALGDTLESVVLYGSAAEGRLRPASDVNVIFVLSRFDAAGTDGAGHTDALGDAVRAAQAAIRLAPMFLLRDEIPHATAAFAVKFADIVRRHRVLYGTDPFAKLVIPRDRLIARLTQVLMNLRIRLRAAYVRHNRFEDQLVGVISDAAGGLRSAAATLLELEGQPRLAPREALLRVVESFGEPRLTDAVAQISVAREQGVLPPGKPREVVLALDDLAGRMHDRATTLGPAAS